MEQQLIEIMNQQIPNKKEYKQCLYIPTKHKLSKTYDMINHVIFDNELEKCNLNIRPMRGVWGCQWPHKRKGQHKSYIEMQPNYPCEQFFVSVLAHEMVHQWQWEIVEPARKGKKELADHGRVFWSWRKPVEQYGINFGHYIPHYV